MSKDFEDDENKNKLGNTLDYYNDEVSRKAVGQLFSGIEDFEAMPEQKPIEKNAYSKRPPQKEEQINSRFYEDSRAKKDAQIGDNIVTGFKNQDDDDDDDEQDDSEYEYQSEPTPIDSERAQREAYRRQFLDGYSTDVRRAGVNRGDKPERDSRTARPRPAAQPSRNTGSFDADTDTDDDSGQRVALPGKRGSSRTPSHDYKLQKTPERKSSVRNAQGRDIDIVAKRTEKKRDSGSYSNAPALNLTEAPIFKIIAGIFVLMLLVMVFLIVNINGANKKLKVYKDAELAVAENAPEIAALQTQNESLKQKNGELTSEVGRLNLRIEDLENQLNPSPQTTDPSGTTASAVPGEGTTYTVVSGDNLSKISKKFYNDVTSVDKIMSANNMTNTNIKVGQVLKIPQ